MELNDSYNGYEDVMDVLKGFTKDKYLSLSDEFRQEMINQVFYIYRSRNILPYLQYSNKGVKKEIMSCINKDVSIYENVASIKCNHGSSLCRFIFPNLQRVNAGGVSNNSPYDKFMDDHKLKRAIKFCLEHKSVSYPCVPSAIKDGIEMLGGNVATNFSPMRAKWIYEKYVPYGGVIYDFSCGFGGRMLGALSSKNNYRYFGVEPNSETFENLKILGKHIEEATSRRGIYGIKKIGSEIYNESAPDKFADFAFSSPPYFNLEVYSNEDTQCYNKFPLIDNWFSGYVEPTIANIYKILKDDALYAVNIADFNMGNKRVEFVDKWIEISNRMGFELIEVIPMKLELRAGNKNKNSKHEGIYVFKKANK